MEPTVILVIIPVLLSLVTKLTPGPKIVMMGRTVSGPVKEAMAAAVLVTIRADAVEPERIDETSELGILMVELEASVEVDFAISSEIKEASELHTLFTLQVWLREVRL